VTGRQRGALLAEAAALLVLVVGALAYASRSGDSLEADADEPADPPTPASTPSTAPNPSAEPPPTTERTSRPTSSAPDDGLASTGGSRLVSSGGLAYPALGDPWQLATGERYAFVDEIDGEVGEYVEVEQWSHGPYSAFVLIGAFSGGAEVLTRGPSGLAGGCEDLAAQIAERYYAAGTGVVHTVASRPVTVGGRPAHRVELEAEISDPDLETTSETVIVEVVQVGPTRAAVVYATLPDLRGDLRPDIDRALSSLRVT